LIPPKLEELRQIRASDLQFIHSDYLISVALGFTAGAPAGRFQLEMDQIELR
jgi:hypothetical protein